MKEFISHIDYLIQKHNCVIIPDFGGFVLSHEGASFGVDGSVLPPKITVGFNSELMYNDGLLAESYMSVYSLSYDVACKRIAESVRRLNTILSMGHPVQIGRLGKLSIDKSNKLIFLPNPNLSIFHPETFGLSAVNMRRLSDIASDKAKTKRTSIYRRVLAGAGTAAAAAILFFMVSTPISEDNTIQKSSLFTDLVSSHQMESPTRPTAEVMENIPVSNENDSQLLISEVVKTDETISVADSHKKILLETPKVVEKEKVVAVKPPVETNPKAKTVGSKKFFVIISSTNSTNSAQKLVDQFVAEGLVNSKVLESNDNGRVRVYADAFETRDEAEKYLLSIKKDKPQFHDAWLYTKK